MDLFFLDNNALQGCSGSINLMQQWSDRAGQDEQLRHGEEFCLRED